MVRKIEVHLENGTWKLVKPPPGRKEIGSKRVFKVKRNPDGTVKRYKTRLVTKGQDFKLRDLGPMLFLHGVQIDSKHTMQMLHLSQCQYLSDLLDHFSFMDCSPVSMPLDPGLCLNMSQCP
jgi:hypothetical protein